MPWARTERGESVVRRLLGLRFELYRAGGREGGGGGGIRWISSGVACVLLLSEATFTFVCLGF